jgi:hypothetical protein
MSADKLREKFMKGNGIAKTGLQRKTREDDGPEIQLSIHDESAKKRMDARKIAQLVVKTSTGTVVHRLPSWMGWRTGMTAYMATTRPGADASAREAECVTVTVPYRGAGNTVPISSTRPFERLKVNQSSSRSQ